MPISTKFPMLVDLTHKLVFGCKKADLAGVVASSERIFSGTFILWKASTLKRFRASYQIRKSQLHTLRPAKQRTEPAYVLWL